MPGVEAASATCCVPLAGRLRSAVLDRRPAARRTGRSTAAAAWMTVSPGYFDVFKIPVKRGRAFNDRDDAAAPPVVVINEAMARQFWPKGDPLERSSGHRPRRDARVRRRAGAADHRRRRRHARRRPQQRPAADDVHSAGAGARRARTRSTSASRRWRGWSARGPSRTSLSAAIQEQLRQATGLPVSDVRSMDEVVSRSTSRQRFNMWLMTRLRRVRRCCWPRSASTA